MEDLKAGKKKTKSKQVKDYAMRYITRVNYDRTPPGWFVRFYADDRELFTYEYFWDSQHGGKAGSLRAAKDYRDWIEENWPRPDRYRGWCGLPYGFLHKVRTDSKSGITGVWETEYKYLKRVKDRKGKIRYYVAWVHNWNASWTDEGKNRCKSFSINKHGYYGAKKLAVAHRKKMEAYLKAKGQNGSSRI